MRNSTFSTIAYRAKIRKIGHTKSLVHYTGWNKRYDEWVSNHLILKLPEKEVNSGICKLNMKQQIDRQQQELLQYFLSKRNTDREQKRDVMVDDDAIANSKKEEIYQNAFARLVKEKR